MSRKTLVTRSDGCGTLIIRTKPCWICGQHSEIQMPSQAYYRMRGMDIHPSVAWPQGTHEQHVLLMSGTHSKCWDQEFPHKPY